MVAGCGRRLFHQAKKGGDARKRDVISSSAPATWTKTSRPTEYNKRDREIFQAISDITRLERRNVFVGKKLKF